MDLPDHLAVALDGLTKVALREQGCQLKEHFGGEDAEEDEICVFEKAAEALLFKLWIGL